VREKERERERVRERGWEGESARPGYFNWIFAESSSSSSSRLLGPPAKIPSVLVQYTRVSYLPSFTGFLCVRCDQERPPSIPPAVISQGYSPALLHM
jgi:hypothetical protein